MKYFFAILLSAVLLAACAAPAVKSEPMPTNQPAGALSGRLIFGRAGEDGKYHLELIDLETRETHVYTGKGNRIAPSFSPDGQRFVFAADAAGTYDLYLSDLSGGDVQRFTTFSAAESEPRWSPDGQWIAYQSNGYGDYDIYIIPAAGGESARLTEEDSGETQPSWAPDGKRIAFVSDRDGDFEIYILALESKKVTQLTSNSVADASPAWSPDGSSIAYLSKRGTHYDLYLINADGSGEKALVSGDAAVHSPAWSPDGTLLAFVSDIPGKSRILVLEIASGETKEVLSSETKLAGLTWGVMNPPGVNTVQTASR